MYRLIIRDIAERSHAAAVKRGQDVSALGCIAALQREQREYWLAKDKGAEVANIRSISAKAANSTDKEFTDLYEAEVHNTASDELADVLITAATWLYTAETAESEGGEVFDPDRCVDVMLLSGAVQFVCNQIEGPDDAERIQMAVNMKLRYNELRKD